MHREASRGVDCSLAGGAPDPDTQEHPSFPSPGHENRINPTGRHFKAPTRTDVHLAWIFICENYVRNTADKKESVGIVYLDFLKAVEKVSLIGGC